MKILEKIRENYLLIGILILASILRLYQLDYQSIWIDEIITMKECDPRLTFKESYDIMFVWENNPVLYYFSVKLFSILFGHTTFVVRLFSVIFGVLGVYMFYLIGKEIENKRVGLIAALLASVNYFFILYSQEARVYIMLIFLTVFSFYRLIKFIKNSTLKNALLYGLSLTLMINSHFFGLFLMVSQAVILFVFLFDIEKSKRLSYCINAAIGGFLALFLWFLVSWKIFKIAADIQAFWIPAPTPDVITGIFKEFFGNSEAVLFLIMILTVFYFIKVFSTKNELKRIRENNLIFGFVIILCWILVTIYIPYLRSYLKIPMLTSRYLIVVLPAIVLLLAISINKIKAATVRNCIILLFLIASATDLIVVKKNYTEIRKSQYREITAKIKEKNKSNDKIVSAWGWHMSYFFNTDPRKETVILKPFEDYINEIKTSKKLEPFWYLDGHFRPYALSPDAEAYLNNNFILLDNLEYFDTWAKHYVPKPGIENTIFLDINEFEPIKTDNNVNILLFSNSTTKSKPIELEKSNYRLAIKSRSIPEVPINGENAHLTLSVNGKKIGAYFLTEKEEAMNYFEFSIPVKGRYQIELTFDNDLVLDNNDRNALVFSVSVEKL